MNEEERAECEALKARVGKLEFHAGMKECPKRRAIPATQRGRDRDGQHDVGAGKGEPRKRLGASFTPAIFRKAVRSRPLGSWFVCPDPVSRRTRQMSIFSS